MNFTPIAAAFENKSSYYARAYFDQVSSRSIHEVPVLSIQGFTDPLFPVTETLQMFRRLKAADPAYPVWMVFGDIGPGQTLEIRTASDVGRSDLEAWIRLRGHELVESHGGEHGDRVLVRKGVEA